MQPQSYQSLKAAVLAKGHKWFGVGAFNLNIIGVRNSANTANEFDDTMFVAYVDDKGNEVVKSYTFTSDPGETYLKNPLSKDGAAIMCVGQYLSAFQIGFHHPDKQPPRKHLCLRQILPIKYVRDNDKDGKADYKLFDNPKNIISGVFNTNIHRADSSWKASMKRTFRINPYGAGCQVFEYADNFEEFMNLVLKSASIHGNIFSYTLMIDKDFK
jgi:hypothetical protein